MTLKELKQNIIGKSFTDQYDTTWNFISENTLAWGVGLNIGNAAHYEYFEDDGLIYLKHNGAFGTNNDMTVDILEEDPLEITLMDRHNPKKVFVLA
jgi:hypothetical protein